MIDADGFIAVLFCGGDSLQDIFCFHVQGLFGHVSLPGPEKIRYYMPIGPPVVPASIPMVPWPEENLGIWQL